MTHPNITLHSQIPELVEHCDSRRMAMWAAAVRSFNPLHFDYEFARRAGLPGPNVNGAFKLALFGRTIHEWLNGECSIKNLSSRYLAMDIIETDIRCGGEVTELPEDGRSVVSLSMWTEGSDGQKTTEGTAKVQLR